MLPGNQNHQATKLKLLCLLQKAFGIEGPIRSLTISGSVEGPLVINAEKIPSTEQMQEAIRLLEGGK